MVRPILRQFMSVNPRYVQYQLPTQSTEQMYKLLPNTSSLDVVMSILDRFIPLYTHISQIRINQSKIYPDLQDKSH